MGQTPCWCQDWLVSGELKNSLVVNVKNRSSTEGFPKDADRYRRQIWAATATDAPGGSSPAPAWGQVAPGTCPRAVQAAAQLGHFRLQVTAALTSTACLRRKPRGRRLQAGPVPRVSSVTGGCQQVDGAAYFSAPSGWETASSQLQNKNPPHQPTVRTCPAHPGQIGPAGLTGSGPRWRRGGTFLSLTPTSRRMGGAGEMNSVQSQSCAP